MFWSVADDLYNVNQLSENRQKNYEAAMTRKVPDSDLALLNLSFDHMLVYFQITDSSRLIASILEHEPPMILCGKLCMLTKTSRIEYSVCHGHYPKHGPASS
jgi:hypothetical protein